MTPFPVFLFISTFFVIFPSNYSILENILSFFFRNKPKIFCFQNLSCYNKFKIGSEYMTDKIMQDNQLYLTEWMRYNPSIAESNTLEGNFLCFKDGEKIDISRIYLPEILYNEAFRRDITNAEEMNGYDFFQIIKLYSQTNEVLEKEYQEQVKYPAIQDMAISKDEKGTLFIVFSDNQGKKYRYDTANPQQIMQLYQSLKQQKSTVTLKDLGSVIQNVN